MSDEAFERLSRTLERLPEAIAAAIVETMSAEKFTPPRVAYSIPEAAQALGVSIDTIRGAIDRGVIRSVKIGKEHRISVRRLQKLFD